MSNPCINRWGLNSLWHHYWFSDSKYYLNLQHDTAVLELLQVYLNYGSDFTTKMLWNPFWYKTSARPALRNLFLYYRWLPVYNDILLATTNYQFRLNSEERFNTRINVLKFNSWYVVNLYWFQPDKKRKHRLKLAKLKSSTTVQTFDFRSTSNVSKLNNLIRISASSARYNF